MRDIRRFLKLLTSVIIVMAFSCVVCAQVDDDPDAPRLKVKGYKGWYKFVDQYGDTVRMIELYDVYIYPPLVFKNKKEEDFYWRTVRDVRKTLPYAQTAGRALLETYEYVQTIPDEKMREKHLKDLEKELVAKYKPQIMKMTRNQGKVLLKLITRETDQSSFNIVKAFLGSFRAAFWQGVGRIFGMNMRGDYNPSKDREDEIIERVATLIERGVL